MTHPLFAIDAEQVADSACMIGGCPKDPIEFLIHFLTHPRGSFWYISSIYPFESKSLAVVVIFSIIYLLPVYLLPG